MQKNKFIPICFLLLLISFSTNRINAQLTGGWFSQSTPYGNGLNDVKFINENTGITVGYNGKILKTTNGGDNWINLNNSGTQKKLNSISFLSSSNIFIAGDSGIILKSTDFGDSWISLNSRTGSNINAIVFKHPETGFAAGNNGTLLKTTNSGVNWTGTFSDTSADFNSMSYVNDRFIWALGQKPDSMHVMDVGFLIKTTNLGVSWNVVTPELTDFYIGKSIYFTDSLTGFCGFCSTVLKWGILRTSDGGTKWECLWGGFHSPNSIFFVNSSTGICVGQGNYDIQITTNSGHSWYASSTEFPFPILQSAFFINPLTGWVVGTQLLKTTTAGGLVTSISTETNDNLSDYSLYQNYPNPFNPVTKISFKCQSATGGTGYVSLNVFDVLGKEVVVLVNEKKNPGSYTVEFDARLSARQGSNLPSGVYFYSLIVDGKVIDTKKMLMIK